jgi:hypothetical protein
VTLPLWRPSQVDVGAPGFLSKPDGRFETLFNALNPRGLRRHLPARWTTFQCCLVTARLFRVISDRTSVMPRNKAFIMSTGCFLWGMYFHSE